MHGGIHPRELGAPHGPRVARHGVRKKQLLDHDIIRLADCVPQPPDSFATRIPRHFDDDDDDDVLYITVANCFIAFICGRYAEPLK